MKKILLFSLLFTLIATNLMAEEQKDTAFANLYRRYFQLYTEGNESIFYDASAKMKDYYLRNNKYDSYYKIALNEILYDTEQGKTYRAIKKCNNLLNEMNARGKRRYHIVYSAMGNIYDMRGNYRMAKKYFQDALNACEPNDTGSLISIYSRIASLQAHREPLKAKEINELFGKMAVKHTQYYKVHTQDEPELITTDDVFNTEAQVLREIGYGESCVIAGRSAFFVLKAHPNHISILIQAPMKKRIERVMEKQGLTREQAEKDINKVDKWRDNYVKKYAGTSRYDTRNYDLVINMAELDEDDAVELIMDYIDKSK